MTVRTHLRPDGRLVATCAGGWTLAAAREAAQASTSEARTVIVTIDPDSADERDALERAGLRVARTEAIVEIPVEPALQALAEARLPDGVVARRADEIQPERLRRLDDAIRGDVPGTDGWRSSPETFADDTYGDPGYDPATYLVAVSAADDEPIGIVRIWMNRSGPRIGLWGVLPAHRRRGIAAGLLALALRAAHRRGARRVTTEFDEANAASAALARRVGAGRIGAILELAFDPRIGAGASAGDRSAGRDPRPPQRARPPADGRPARG